MDFGWNLLCILGYRSLVVPNRHPSHHPSHLASLHRGQGCARAYRNPRALCPRDRRSSHVHPSLQASLLQDPKRNNKSVTCTCVHK